MQISSLFCPQYLYPQMLLRHLSPRKKINQMNHGVLGTPQDAMAYPSLITDLTQRFPKISHKSRTIPLRYQLRFLTIIPNIKPPQKHIQLQTVPKTKRIEVEYLLLERIRYWHLCQCRCVGIGEYYMDSQLLLVHRQNKTANNHEVYSF